MKRPPEKALQEWAKWLKGEKPDVVEFWARHSVYGGRTGIAYDNAVAKGEVEGDVRSRVATFLFEPGYWDLFDREQQRAIMRARCVYDLFWFATAVLGYNKDRPGGGVELDPQLHGELAEELVYRRVPWFIALMFRGGLKTTIVSIADSIRRYLLKQHVKRLIVSDTRSIGVGILAEIKSHIETNELLINLWPERFDPALIKRQKWAEDAITLPGNLDRRVGTIEVVGIDGNITGKHFPEIVLDDVVTQANAATPEQRQKVLDAVRLLLSILDPGGRMWVAGTRYHYEDLYSWLLQNASVQPHNYYVHIRPIYKDNGESAWPAKFPLPEIEKIKVTQGSYIFSCQYLLEPVPEDSEFRRDWVEDPMYDKEELEDERDEQGSVVRQGIMSQLVDIVTTADPAFTEKERTNADYACVMTTGITRSGHIYVLDCTMRKMEAPEFVEVIFDHYNRWKPSLVGIEAQAGQKGLVQLIDKAIQDRRMVMHIVPIHRNRAAKELRIRTRLQPYFARKMIHLRKDMDLLALQLRRFPGWKDDGLDALADAVEILRPRRSRQSAGPHVIEDDVPLNPVTGRR